ncbi:MAG: hypothetical protein E7554_10510 [Ruminococcaceae bacterium]|nr:hypothetical protein [Oscillospiraceae bacterium]
MKAYRSIIALFCILVTLVCLAACGGAAAPEAPQIPDVPVLNSSLPAVRINTADGEYDFITKPVREDKMADNIHYVDATVAVDNCDEEYVISPTDAQVKARGNWTLNYPKKPIRIKFSEKKGMLGMNEGREFKNWLLLADWKDLSMSHNYVALYLADGILGTDGYYVSDYMYVDVYINDHYWGMYLLVEQQEINDGRTTVTEGDKDYTGTDIGYMFEYDAYYRDERNMPNDSGDPTFEIDYGLFAGYKSGKPHPDPYQAEGMHGYTMKSDIYDDAQLDFVANYTQCAYDIITRAIYKNEHYGFNEDYTAIVPIEGKSVKDTVSQVIELDSLVDMFLLNEIVMNPDIAWSSFYLCLDMSENGSKKLIFEAPWDYDSCFGIRISTFTSPGTETNQGMYCERTNNPWLRIFADQDWFMDMVADKWNEVKAAGLFDNTLALIEQQRTVLADNYAQNYHRWMDRVFYGNEELIPELNKCKNQREASEFLTEWLTGRLEYLDSQLGKPAAE